jgi:hypothetical protein
MVGGGIFKEIPAEKRLRVLAKYKEAKTSFGIQDQFEAENLLAQIHNNLFTPVVTICMD